MKNFSTLADKMGTCRGEVCDADPIDTESFCKLVQFFNHAFMVHLVCCIYESMD